MICWNSELWKKCAQNVQGNLCIKAIKYVKYDMPYLAISRLTDHGGPQWILIVRRNRWRAVCGWIALFENDLASLIGKKSADHPERVCFLSLRAKEVMMCGDPFCFFRWTSMQERKIPRVGIFYFACFSKNGRNHSEEWFDFRQKVLKTSIKSIHGQQTEKWWVWKIFVVTGWGIVVECG